MERAALVLVLVAVVGCDRGGGGSSASATAAPAATATPTPSLGDQLRADMEARRQAYLVHSAAGTGVYALISQLEGGATSIDRAPVDALLDFMGQRKDTSDFKCTSLLRLLYLHGTNPAIPSDLRGRAKTALLNFRYWIDQPGQDDMVFWSENHRILFASCEYLAGQRYPTETFTNTGFSGGQHRALARARILRWLDERLRWGFSEFYSPVYYPHDTAPLFNLVDFAQDPEIRTRAAMVLDLILFDLARLTHKGSFGTPAGRAYEEHKFSGRNQSVGDLVEILFGTRGAWRSRGSTAGTPLATTRNYVVPHALLAIGLDKARPRTVERARNGISFTDAAAEGLGFTSYVDGITWWSMGAYMAPETVVLTRQLVSDWNLWSNSSFALFDRLRWVPPALLPAASAVAAPFSEGSFLSTSNTYTFRTPDAQLSSLQAYRPGQVGFQQHAWQATLDLDACVWTTAPAPLGRSGPGEWTGSGSLPQVTQVEDVAVVLYNPGVIQRLAFSPATHAWFPRAAFDEVRERGPWTVARKGDGYVGLYSAQPTRWTTGTYAGNELWADGFRNVWICQVGNRAEDGAFADFVDALTRATVTVQGAGNWPEADPLTVLYEAPGLGRFEARWGATTTLDGSQVHAASFPRFDSPYAQQAWGDPLLTIDHSGLTLIHDRLAGTRRGDGL